MLWAGAAAKVGTAKAGRRIGALHTAWWGVFPDVAAFAPLFIWLIYGWMTGSARPDFGPPDLSSSGTQGILLDYAQAAYNYSHSLVIFSVVFCGAWIIRHRPVWELGGWGLHVLMDIPTHRADFFPTPYLWPFPHPIVDGISWAEGWFMAANYLSLAVVYLAIYFYRRRKISAE